MTTYSDFNPEGTTRTTKRGIARHVPLFPDHFNHRWFDAYVDDFLNKNVLENDGVISGCVISQDGGNDAINITSGEVYINGVGVAFTSSGSPFVCTTDGWYIAYINDAGAVTYGLLENDTTQGALTPDDSVVVGYAVRGNSVFYINSFFNVVNLDIDGAIITGSTIDADLNTITNLEHGNEVDSPSSGVHGVSGSVVGTTNTQTLTNKTIDADLNTIINLPLGWETFDLQGTPLSISGISSPALAAINGTDVAFIDATNDELRLYRWGGSSWSLQGTPLSVSTANSALAAINGTDVAFIDNTNNELRLYRWGGSSWSLQGTPLSVSTSFSALAAINGTDVAFISNTNDELRLYRWGGSSWSLQGTPLFISGAGIPALSAINGTDVAFIDADTELLSLYRNRVNLGSPHLL